LSEQSVSASAVADAPITSTLVVANEPAAPTLTMPDQPTPPAPAVPGRPTSPAPTASDAPVTSTPTGQVTPLTDDAPDLSTEENTTMESGATAGDDGFQDFVSSLKEHVRADRRCHVHEQLRHMLIAELHGARLVPSQSPLADITCEGPKGSMLYEVLGEGGNTYERMREAVLRIREVEHVGGGRAEHLFLVLPQAPEPAWAPGMLSAAFAVTTIWRDGTGWAGDGLGIALGQAFEAGPGPR